jgi:uncharacterized protein
LILPDVNTYVYAYRREAENHDRYATWLAGLVAGGDELTLVDHCLMGFVRVVTHPRIVANPAPTADALAFVDRIRGARRAHVVASTAATWARLTELISQDRLIKANVVADACLAALAISHGCRLATGDRGFARFDGLDFFDPAAD